MGNLCKSRSPDELEQHAQIITQSHNKIPDTDAEGDTPPSEERPLSINVHSIQPITSPKLKHRTPSIQSYKQRESFNARKLKLVQQSSFGIQVKSTSESVLSPSVFPAPSTSAEDIQSFINENKELLEQIAERDEKYKKLQESMQSQADGHQTEIDLLQKQVKTLTTDLEIKQYQVNELQTQSKTDEIDNDMALDFQNKLIYCKMSSTHTNLI